MANPQSSDSGKDDYELVRMGTMTVYASEWKCGACATIFYLPNQTQTPRACQNCGMNEDDLHKRSVLRGRYQE